MTSIAAFHGAGRRYDGTSWAVRDLDLAVGRGEFLTLLGPSGSGKTTALMMLAGFERPDAGRILLEGRDTAGVPPHRRNLGVVFQSYALFPHMTVAENIAFPLEARRVPRAERTEQVRQALQTVRLDGLAARKPSQLSGGQQQRVALARALVFKPPLVLLDEPLGALDKQLREELQQEFRRIHRELGITVLFVTHDQGEALTLSDRIAVFRGGQVQQLATPETLYERPANAFVAGFMGENNSMTGTLLACDSDEARVRLDCGPTVTARTHEAMAPNTPCLVTIRPERLAIASENLGEDTLRGTLTDITYLGDQLRLRVMVGSTEVMVKRSAVLGSAGFEQGGPVWLAWQPQHALVFRPDG